MYRLVLLQTAVWNDHTLDKLSTQWIKPSDLGHSHLSTSLSGSLRCDLSLTEFSNPRYARRSTLTVIALCLVGVQCQLHGSDHKYRSTWKIWLPRHPCRHTKAASMCQLNQLVLCQPCRQCRVRLLLTQCSRVYLRAIVAWLALTR